MYEDKRLRLNILALPNQQKVLVIMLALAIVGTLLAIGYNTPQSLFFFLALALSILALRRMLTKFERAAHDLGLREAEAHFTPLQQYIAYLSTEKLHLRRTPRLAIATVAQNPQVLATWRRWYIAIDEMQAHHLQAQIAAGDEEQRMVDALLLHELTHLQKNDHLWIEYARALLHVGIRLILWFALLLIGLVVFLTLVAQSFFTYLNPNTIRTLFDLLLPGIGDDAVAAFFGSVTEYERIAEQAQQVDLGQVLFNVIVNTLPYILLGTILLIVYGQRLFRLREFYADAGAVHVLQDTAPLLKWFGTKFQAAEQHKATRGIGFNELIEQLYRRLVRFHPGPVERVRALQTPESVNGSAWAYGINSGLYILTLNLIMSSTAALALVGSWPMHFPIIAATILVGLYLLTPLVLGLPITRPFWAALLPVMILHGGTIILSLIVLIGLFILSPNVMLDLLERMARNLAWYTRLDPTATVDDPAALLVEALIKNLLQIPLVLLFSAGALWLIIVGARRILMWYALPNAEQSLMRAIYLLIGWVVGFIAFVLLPPVTDLVLWRSVDASSLLSLIYWTGVACMAVFTLIFGWWFVCLDRLYAHRCPTCDNHASGFFALGKRCLQCNELLHPWLGALYAFPQQEPRRSRDKIS